MKFYFDADTARREVESLRRAGHDAFYVHDVPGLCEAQDKHHAENAQRLNRILVTKDADYGELRFKHGIPNTGVLYIQPEANKPGLAERLPGIVDDHKVELERGAFISIDANKLRIRELEVPSHPSGITSPVHKSLSDYEPKPPEAEKQQSPDKRPGERLVDRYTRSDGDDGFNR